MLDNIAGLILMATLLSGFGIDVNFVVSAMVPGTALGVLVGDLAFFVLAFWLAKRTGRDDVTAMPLGLDTPSTFGIILFILGPSYLQGLGMQLSEQEAAYRTWHIGIWCIVLSGVLKFAMAPFTELIRRVIPRAGLLGSLAASALVLISFIPLLDIFEHPLPGMIALVIVLCALVGRLPLPGRTPGTLGALLVASLVFYAMCLIQVPPYSIPQALKVFSGCQLNGWKLGNSAGFPTLMMLFLCQSPCHLQSERSWVESIARRAQQQQVILTTQERSSEWKLLQPCWRDSPEV